MPYQFRAQGELELLLVTSRTRGRWIIPKGWPIKGLKPQKSAAREAFEEAGVQGEVIPKPIGRYSYDKISDDESGAIPCEVLVFTLNVKRQLKDWPEASQREARWMRPELQQISLRKMACAELLRPLPKRRVTRLRRQDLRARAGRLRP